MEAEFIFNNKILPYIWNRVEEEADNFPEEDLATWNGKLFDDFDCNEFEYNAMGAIAFAQKVKEDGVWEYFNLDDIDSEDPLMEELQAKTLVYLDRIEDDWIEDLGKCFVHSKNKEDNCA